MNQQATDIEKASAKIVEHMADKFKLILHDYEYWRGHPQCNKYVLDKFCKQLKEVIHAELAL